jgi:hypothetical protein
VDKGADVRVILNERDFFGEGADDRINVRAIEDPGHFDHLPFGPAEFQAADEQADAKRARGRWEIGGWHSVTVAGFFGMGDRVAWHVSDGQALLIHRFSCPC